MDIAGRYDVIDERTISGNGVFSLSAVMRVLSIRNLSLHIASSGGSSFKGCSVTEDSNSELYGPFLSGHARTRHIKALAGIYSAKFGSNRVPLSRLDFRDWKPPTKDASAHLASGSFHFEGNWLVVVVGNCQETLDEDSERP